MGQKNTDTAILIFSLSARREAKRKSLFGRGRKPSTDQFFDILIGRTQRLATASGVDTFFIDEGQQYGRTFGERYANAFQQLFDQGYTKVVSIGNDTPDLTAETLQKAIDEIQRKDLVVGPSADGGVYLLGMVDRLFNKKEFLALPWLQDSLYDTLAESAYWQTGGCFSLDVLSDIDDRASLFQFVQSTSDAVLVEFILRQLHSAETIFIPSKSSLFSAHYYFAFALRGPPSFKKAA
jgi:glycosyltransferase A (GT-A) superfamily protein (DUF2064 family)